MSIKKYTTNYLANNNLPIHVPYLITCHTHRHVLELLSKQTQVNFVMISNKDNDCFVIIYLLRYKGCVYITILPVGTSKLVRNSREFAITVFVLILVFSYHFEGFLPGNRNYFAISMNSYYACSLYSCFTVVLFNHFSNSTHKLLMIGGGVLLILGHLVKG